MFRFSQPDTQQILPATSTQAPCVGESIYVDKECILLTVGKFKSMDGEVKITENIIKNIAQVYNSKLHQLRGNGAALNMAHFKPVQLDHSTSANETVGRLLDPLQVKEHEGKLTLFGTIRFIGEENVAKATDGRWTNLSVGIKSLATCELNEVTITPFPACQDAILLSTVGDKSMHIRLSESEQTDLKAKHMQAVSDCMKKHMAEVGEMHDRHTKELAQATPEQIDEIKKQHEDERSAHMAKHMEAMNAANDEYVQTLEKNMGSESTEKDPNENIEDKAQHENKESPLQEKEEHKLSEDKPKDEEKEDKKEEQNEEKTRLSSAFTSMRATQEGLRLRFKQMNIASRLSKFRAEAKITPAEIKKMDLVRLAKANDETIEAIFETIANRQPVIHTAVYGRVDAVNPATVAEKVRLSQLEHETRKNFSSLPKRMNDEKEENESPVNNLEAKQDEACETDLWSEIVKSIKTGDEETAHQMYKKMTGRKLEGGECEADEANMKQLMADFAAFSAQVDEAINLATKVTSITI